MEIVRVLRVIEYVGPRDQVEEQVKRSIHGERQVREMVIRAATIGEYPELLDVPSCDLPPGAASLEWTPNKSDSGQV